jgi:hypothetical protein
MKKIIIFLTATILNSTTALAQSVPHPRVSELLSADGEENLLCILPEEKIDSDDEQLNSYLTKVGEVHNAALSFLVKYSSDNLDDLKRKTIEFNNQTEAGREANLHIENIDFNEIQRIAKDPFSHPLVNNNRIFQEGFSKCYNGVLNRDFSELDRYIGSIKKTPEILPTVIGLTVCKYSGFWNLENNTPQGRLAYAIGADAVAGAVVAAGFTLATDGFGWGIWPLNVAGYGATGMVAAAASKLAARLD